MLSQLIWWSSIALEALLLIRGLQTRLVFRFPYFYSYVTFVLLSDLLALAIRVTNPGYKYTFWSTELGGILFGCCLVLEIYRIGLARFPGTATMTRNALAVIFVLAATKGFIALTQDPGWWHNTDPIELDRSIRIVQAISILAFTLVLLIYAIPIGKNLRGILLGYGLYVGVLAITLTFVPHVGHGFWFYALSACYPVTLVTWLVHLWSYQKHTATPPSTPGGDYKWAAEATRNRLQSARGELSRAVRP
jgi:hypothetical protein